METVQFEAPEARLRELPGGFRYTLGTPQQKAIFHRIIAELLAEEILGSGASATATISALMVATGGHGVRVWTDKVRATLRKILEAESILAKGDKSKLETAKAKAEADHALALETLERAKRDVMLSEVRLNVASSDVRRFDEAANLLANPGQHADVAYRHLQRLREYADAK